MKSLLFLSIIHTLFFSAHSFANVESRYRTPHYDIDYLDLQSAEEITSPTIKLAGSMIEDRKTHDLFGFHCVEISNEPTCKKIRPLYFSNTAKKLITFGPVYTIKSQNPEKPTDQEITTALIDFGKDLNIRWKTENKTGERNVAIGATSLPLLWLGVPTVHALLFTGGVISCPIVCPWIIAGSIAWVPTMLFLMTRDGLVFKSKGKIGETISNLDGWNWSINTKKINHKKFNFFIRVIEREFETVVRFDNQNKKQIINLSEFIKNEKNNNF